MAKKDLTELVFVIDKSGSMTGLESDTVGGYNSLLKSNREGEGEALVSTVLFDNDAHVLHDRVSIEQVRPLSERDYVPGGCTALLDAVGGAIRYHERVQKNLPESLRPERTLVCIATDGYENASKKYTYPQVKHMIDAARERGWEFLFLGANIDAAAEAGKLGIDAECTAEFAASPMGCAAAFDEMCLASTAVRSGGTVASRRG